MATTTSQPFDICVITAANESQVKGYKALLQRRRKNGLLVGKTKFFVFAEPTNVRVGSGGSTIYVLVRLLNYFCQSADHNQKINSIEQAFQGQRILILHSGGESKRVPALSALGKMFFPLPVNSSYPQTIFDFSLDNLSGLPVLENGQLVVACGDVLLSFNPEQVQFDAAGLTGLTYPVLAETASRHGVYKVSLANQKQNLAEVADFFQKPNPQEMADSGCLDQEGRALIDTGIMNFGLEALLNLLKGAGVKIENGQTFLTKGGVADQLLQGRVYLDVYEEIPLAILGKPLSGHTQEKGVDLTDFNTLLKRIPFWVSVLAQGEFFHLGSSQELLDNFQTPSPTATHYNFRRFSRSGGRKVEDVFPADIFLYNSLIDSAEIETDGSCLIEGCSLEGTVKLAGQNLLINIPTEAGEIELKEGICLSCLPVVKDGQKGWVGLIYGLVDSFKKTVNDETATFLNQNLSWWLKEKKIAKDDLWPGATTKDLWQAEVFPWAETPAGAIKKALSWQDEDLDIKKLGPRLSLKDILDSIDYEEFLASAGEKDRKINLANLAEFLKSEPDLPASEILSWLKNEQETIDAVAVIENLVDSSKEELFKARLHKLLSLINSGQTKEKSKEEGLAFEGVKKAIAQGIVKSQAKGNQERKIKIRSDEVVLVSSPVRLDLAGGWSDTPPYCLEKGGDVLNVAVQLNGQPPIQVIGKVSVEPVVKITSVDLGQTVVIAETKDILSFQDPSDWSILAKAGMVVTGIVKENEQEKLADILNRLGGGIDLTLLSAVPAGSGLGVSSILGACIIACLSTILGEDLTEEELFDLVLYQEQLIGTGGGWQDQIGGITKGLKLIHTESGLKQRAEISAVDFKVGSVDNTAGHFLLYYTGQRRMAKNILQRIVAKYLERDPIVLSTIAQLREKARAMKDQLANRDVDGFGKNLAGVWELNKILDPGTTTDGIESIFNQIKPYIWGAKLLGAGGGGFLLIAAQGAREAGEIKQILTVNPPNDKARFFDFQTDEQGLVIKRM